MLRRMPQMFFVASFLFLRYCPAVRAWRRNEKSNKIIGWYFLLPNWVWSREFSGRKKSHYRSDFQKSGKRDSNPRHTALVLHSFRDGGSGSGCSANWALYKRFTKKKSPTGWWGNNKSGKRDSNPRPSAWEADALPTELLPLVLILLVLQVRK